MGIREKYGRAYNIWVKMRQRCRNHPRYAGRGISVCARWHVFLSFWEDMGQAPSGKTLDRVDPRLGYSPGNCRWATPQEQADNRLDVCTVRWRGREMLLREAAALSVVDRDTLYKRLFQHGWSVRRAMEQPLRQQANRPRKEARR